MNSDELFGKFSPMVYNLAFRLCGNAGDAGDIARDAFHKAAKEPDKLRDGSEAGARLYGITVTAWRKRARGGKRFSLRDIIPPCCRCGGADVPPGQQAKPPEAAADAAPEKQALEMAMARLDPEHRAMLLLREMEGRPYREIAEITGKPLGAVKSGISSARETLRLKMNSPLKER